MIKTESKRLAIIVNKSMTISKYKGAFQAKRIMMKAGLPVDLINKLLIQDKDLKKEIKSDQK